MSRHDEYPSTVSHRARGLVSVDRAMRLVSRAAGVSRTVSVEIDGRRSDVGQDLECGARKVARSESAVQSFGRATTTEFTAKGGISVRKQVIVRIGLLMSSVAALVLAGGASRGVR